MSPNEETRVRQRPIEPSKVASKQIRYMRLLVYHAGILDSIGPKSCYRSAIRNRGVVRKAAHWRIRRVFSTTGQRNLEMIENAGELVCDGVILRAGWLAGSVWPRSGKGSGTSTLGTEEKASPYIRISLRTLMHS